MPKTAPKLVAKNGVTARQNLLKTFSIDHTSEEGVRYVGKFTTKKLSISDISSLGVRKAQLNAGMHHDPMNPGMGVDAQTDDFNTMIAHLDIALKESPEWWDLDNITDADLLAAVFEEVVSHENSFLATRRKRSEHSAARDDAVVDGEEMGAIDLSETDGDGTASEMVEQEVQAALEP